MWAKKMKEQLLLLNTIISEEFGIISSIKPVQIVVLFARTYHWKDNSESHRTIFREQAWELLIHKPWHRAHRNTDRALANAGKHESGVQRLKVAQIFTTQSPIQNLHPLSCNTAFPLALCEVFLNGFAQVVGVSDAATTFPVQPEWLWQSFRKRTHKKALNRKNLNGDHTMTRQWQIWVCSLQWASELQWYVA